MASKQKNPFIIMGKIPTELFCDREKESDKLIHYLTNGNKAAIQVYRWIYILAVLIGPFMTLSQVWTIADIFNGLMAAPNLIALVVLSGVIAMETKDFFRRLESGEYQENLTFHVR